MAQWPIEKLKRDDGQGILPVTHPDAIQDGAESLTQNLNRRFNEKAPKIIIENGMVTGYNLFTGAPQPRNGIFTVGLPITLAPTGQSFIEVVVADQTKLIVSQVSFTNDTLSGDTFCSNADGIDSSINLARREGQIFVLLGTVSTTWVDPIVTINVFSTVHNSSVNILEAFNTEIVDSLTYFTNITPVSINQHFSAGNAVTVGGYSVDDTKGGSNATTDNAIWTAHKIKQELNTIPSTNYGYVVVGTSANYTAAEVDFLCDGTDDDAVLNQAMIEAFATLKDLLLLNGEYRLRGRIEMLDGVSIKGHGRVTLTPLSPFLGTGLIENRSDISLLKSVSIENLFFNLGAVKTWAVFLPLNTGHNISIINCEMTNSSVIRGGFFGMTSAASGDIKISGCKIEGGWGVSIPNPNSNLLFTNNIIHRLYDFSTVCKSVISNNIFTDSLGTAFTSLNNTSQILISNNIFDSRQQTSISSTTYYCMENVTMIGNTFIGVPIILTLRGSNTAKFINNSVRNTSCTINLLGAGITIVGNDFTRCTLPADIISERLIFSNNRLNDTNPEIQEITIGDYVIFTGNISYPYERIFVNTVGESTFEGNIGIHRR